MKLVDLSVVINEDTPVYPGDPKVKIQPAGILKRDGYEDHYVGVGTHVGTHIDAPAHMVAGGKTLNEFSPDKFIGRGIYINVNEKFDINIVKQVSLKEEDIVLFDTGMSRVYKKKEYYEGYPAISEEVANYLVEKKIKIVGVDMCSVDHEPFPIHRILLKNNILIIENLTNLSQLKGKSFRVLALPIKLQLDGAPARVFAEIV